MVRMNDQAPLLTVLILTGQYVVWLGLKNILERSQAIQVIGEPLQRGGNQDLITTHRPDVIILDTETERDVIGTIQQIREFSPISKIVTWSGLEDRDRLREAVEYGVDGVLLKIHPPAVVLATITSLYLSSDDNTDCGAIAPASARQREPHSQRELSAQVAAWPDALTEREREIIQLVGQGMSNKDIAYQLSISDSTVRHHLTSIFDKVDVSNRQKLLLHTHHFHFPQV